MKSFKLPLILLLIVAVAGGGLFLWFRLAGNSPEALRGRADKSYAAGRHEEALLEYRMLLGVDPENAHACRRAASIWVERGAPLRAMPFLREAVRLEPGDLPTRHEWAKVLLGLGDLNGARQQAVDILDQSPTDSKALLLLANTSLTQEQRMQARGFLDAFDPATHSAYHLANAALLAQEGNQQELRNALERAGEIDPDSPEVQFALANYRRATGDTEASLAILREASRHDGAEPAAMLRYARALAAAGRTDEALQRLKELVGANKEFLPASLLMAELQVRNEDYDKAMESLKRVQSIDPLNLEAGSIEARIHIAKGEPAKAVEVYETLDQAFPNAPRIKFLLASCYVRNGEPVQARTTLKAAMNVAPELSQEHAEGVMQLAELELRSGDPGAASKWLTPLVSSRPELHRARLLLGRAYAAEGRLEEAEDLFRSMIEKQPDNPLGHVMLAEIFKHQKKNEEAVASFETARILAPNDLTIISQLVELDLLAEDYASAHERLRTQLAKRSPSWRAWFLKGSVFSAEGKWDQAETVYQKALDLNPESLAVYDRLIDSYLRAGDPAKAIAKLKTLAGEQPDSVKHRMALCLLLDQQGELEQAAAAYEALVAEQPEFIPALNNLAYLYSVDMDDPARAEPIARTAYELDPENAAVADSLGWILVRLGGEERLQEGLRLLREAAAGLPDHPEVQYHLGIALSKTGAREDARRALEQAIRGETDFPGKNEAAKVLASFEGSSSPGTSVAELEELRQNAPFNLPVRLQLGQLYLSQGDSAKAIDAYEDALKLETHNALALKALAKLQRETAPEQARDYARRAWESDPSDLEAAALQGSWVYRDGLFSQAYTILRPGARTGRDPAVTAMCAHAAFNTGKIAEAREMMRKIPADAPQHAEARTFLTLTADPGPDGLPALEAAAETALEADPTYAPALIVRTARLERTGETAAAIKHYEDLHRRLPDFHPVTTRLAALYADDPERLDQAEALALQALEQGGTSPGLDRVLGEVLARKGQAAAAITHLERAHAATPLDAEGQFFLGKSYIEADQADQGRQTLEAALKAGLSADLVTRAGALLKDEESE